MFETRFTRWRVSPSVFRIVFQFQSWWRLTIGRKLCDRYGGVVTNCEFSIAVKNDGDRERLRQLASDIQSEGVARARRTILGIAA